ncbi:FadR/GntR family transcriptional regulator [Desulfonatronovibrio hydrogenovorans]|uniref:FadR/GntR family transcriptional regulator n=1 Tax=Desulfonatronovibrio hydrogenovorans TaxID=53245 RepID=UPI00055470F4|nr:GntR family transcriptional regulator [Desulfonatronovibrio hydrogenovorans]
MRVEHLFEPVKAGRAGEDIALQIQAAILSGSIVPGERLPSERELQNLFKTGRGVVREAFKVLKHKGLIEIRKGAKGGAYIKNLEVVSVSESFALFLRQNQTDPMHLIEFRESIDYVITDLAIAKGSVEEKKLLSTKADQLAEAVKNNGTSQEELVELDKELNILFAKMTKNPIFEWIMRAVQLGFSSMDNALYEDHEYRNYAVKNWQDTAREIAASDPIKAKSFISYHYMILRKKAEQIQKELSARTLDQTSPQPPDSSE